MTTTPDSHAGGPGFKSRCRPTNFGAPLPYTPLQFAKMCQGSQKGWCTRKPSTRDDKKKQRSPQSSRPVLVRGLLFDLAEYSFFSLCGRRISLPPASWQNVLSLLHGFFIAVPPPSVSWTRHSTYFLVSSSLRRKSAFGHKMKHRLNPEWPVDAQNCDDCWPTTVILFRTQRGSVSIAARPAASYAV